MDETIANEFVEMLKESAGPKPKQENKEAGSKQQSQTDKLLQLADGVELFHDEVGSTFAKFPTGGHFEIRTTKGKLFSRWLVGQYYDETGRAPSPDNVRQAISVLEAKATHKGPMIPLSLRAAAKDDAFWYDLCDVEWRAIRIVPGHWEVVDNPPVLFQRFANTGAQVIPIATAAQSTLRVLDFVNLTSKDDQILFIVELVTCLIPNIPHVVTVWHGEKGAAKSTALRIRRRLVDPAYMELNIMPRDHGELVLLLSKNWAPSFDNLDGLPSAISDILCIAATGGGMSKRELYSDDGEVILNFKRCVSLNGIAEPVTRADLLDRSLLFELQRIGEEGRKSEADFWKDFEAARPQILGGMFTLLSKAMAIYPTVNLAKLPRMADFAKWGYAIAEALYPGGGVKFIAALDANRGRANEEAISASPIAAAIVALVYTKGNWEGSAAELLIDLHEIACTEKIDTHSKAWPQNARSLAKRIKLIKSNLLEAGIQLRETKDTHGKKAIYSLYPKGGESIPPKPATSASLSYQGFQRAELRRNSAELDFCNPPLKAAPQAGCGIGGIGGNESGTLGEGDPHWDVEGVL